ncbi:MAG: hypothetical protein IPQ08_06075 [Chitinophagaceae bacterium]|nr:hypothetical protein [Chitinophagaceae bacterium]
MTEKERIKVGEYWLGLAMMYGKELPKTSLKIMLDSINDLNADDILIALDEWVRISKVGRHPYPPEIRLAVKKELSPESKALEVATRIRSANNLEITIKTRYIRSLD